MPIGVLSSYNSGVVFWAVTAVREWCIRPVGREGFGHLE